jgi:hypothetical protein
LEGSQKISRSHAQKSILEVGSNSDPESSEKKALAREEDPAMEEEPAIGGGSLREECQASRKSREAGQDMGQMQYSVIANRSNEIHTRRSCSPETKQVFSTPPTVLETMKGVLEELIRVNMLCGYFGNCIQSYNIYMHYERGRLREIKTCLLFSSLFFMKPLNMVSEPRV